MRPPLRSWQTDFPVPCVSMHPSVFRASTSRSPVASCGWSAVRTSDRFCARTRCGASACTGRPRPTSPRRPSPSAGESCSAVDLERGAHAYTGRSFRAMELALNRRSADGSCYERRSVVRTAVAIAGAGALGALARYGVEGAITRRVAAFPWGTFVVNVSGSFALGFVVTLLGERLAVASWLRAALAIGFLGAYTPFSTLSLESYRLLESRSEEGLAGATVLRGIEGFGADSRLHTARILRLSEDLPIVIEIVDSAEQIDRILPLLDEMVGEGMVTLERVEVIAYRGSRTPR